MVAEDGLVLELFMAGQSSMGHCLLPAHSQQAVTPHMGQAPGRSSMPVAQHAGLGPRQGARVQESSRVRVKELKAVNKREKQGL